MERDLEQGPPSPRPSPPGRGRSFWTRVEPWTRCAVSPRFLTGGRKSGALRKQNDGVRFFLIIFKIGTLYSPLKVYFPIAAVISGLGLINYVYSVFSSDSWRVTNMSTLMILSGVFVFLIGLLAEQPCGRGHVASVEASVGAAEGAAKHQARVLGAGGGSGDE